MNTQQSSRDVRRDLIAMRVKYGADTAIGHRCSNIVEMLRQPEPPAAQIQIQMADLKRLLGGVQ